MTETCEPDQVHLITNVETTLAVAADVDQTAPIHAALAAKGLLPGDHLLDAGFVSSDRPVQQGAGYCWRIRPGRRELQIYSPILPRFRPIGRQREFANSIRPFSLLLAGRRCRIDLPCLLE